MGKFQAGNPGKPKGATNIINRTVKETVLAAFNELQSDPKANIIAWGKSQPGLFYPIAAKLIPTEVRAEISVPEGIKLQFITDPGCQPIKDDQQTDTGDTGVLGQQSGL